jgi:Transglutaminase-like superfamily
MRIFFQAYFELLGLEYSFVRRDFPSIYEKVRNASVCARPPGTITADEVCRAIDLAAALYFKQTLCLQRSAATACLLKKHGFPAEMVIGVQHLPFLAHAWVELDGHVVNDNPYMAEIYSVMTRC